MPIFIARPKEALETKLPQRAPEEVVEVDLSDPLTLRIAIADDVRKAMILLTKKRKSKTRAGLAVLCRALCRALHPLMVSRLTESLARVEEEVEEDIALLLARRLMNIPTRWNGDSALRLAVRSADVNMLEILLHHGANVQARNRMA